MSKNNNRNNYNRDRSNYNKPDPDLTSIDEIHTDEEAEEPELSIKPEDNVFIPNALVYNSFGISPTTVTYRILMKDLKDMFTKVCKSQIDANQTIGLMVSSIVL